MARPTARGWGLLVVAAGAYLAARLIGTWELYLVAFAFLAAVLVSWLLVQLAARAVTVSRELEPERPVAGDQMRLSFRARNTSLLPGLVVMLHDATGDLRAEEGPLEFESMSSRGERACVIGPWPARRGVHHLPAMRVDAEDPMGLVHVGRISGPPLDFTVYPRLADLASCVVFADLGRRRERGRRGLPALGAAEFRGIRPHHPGEPLKHVDWKATARTGALMLREMDDPASGDVSVVLDAAASHVAGVPPETSFELAVQAAGSVAAFALRAGRGVSLLLQEDAWRPVKLSPHSDGQYRLLERLARAKTHEASLGGALSLQALLAGGAALDHTEALTLVVLAMDERMARSIIALRERGRRIAVIHVAAGSFDPEPRQMDSKAVLLSLQAAGVRCLTLRRGDDLRTVLSVWPSERGVRVL